MKVIIEIPDYEYEQIREYYEKNDTVESTYGYIYRGTHIPDNATNGDMMKIMFPKVDFHEMAFTVHATTKVTSNGIKGSISYDFWKDWWNSLYQKGGKE